MDIYRQAISVAKDTRNTRWVAPALLAADTALCALIIWKVPCRFAFPASRAARCPLDGQRWSHQDTEIDWKAYMQQVHQYLEGERDYTRMKGDTGPLVYPAAHVYIYSVLYRVTDGGKDIFMAQLIFGGLYLSILCLVMACYRQAKVRWQSNDS